MPTQFDRKLTVIQVNAYGTYASYYMQQLMPDKEMYARLNVGECLG